MRPSAQNILKLSATNEREPHERPMPEWEAMVIAGSTDFERGVHRMLNMNLSRSAGHTYQCKRMIVIIALLATCIVTATGSIAEESAAALCSAKLRKFVPAIDLIFAERPLSVEDYYGPIRDYLSGTRGCNVDEVISIAKKSKYFSELSESSYTTYVIVFYGNNVTVSFGLKKDTGDIETPAAYTEFI